MKRNLRLRAWGLGFALAALSAPAPPTLAEEMPEFDPSVIAACIDEAGGPALGIHCVGEGALACWHAKEGSGDENTIPLCLVQEQAYWDERIEALAGRFESEWVPLMQEDWDQSRFSRCEYVAELWDQNSAASVMWHDCMVQLTGQHALWLETLEDAR